MAGRPAREEIATAVDMMLCVPQSLDNAIALPTCPQQEQKTPREA